MATHELKVIPPYFASLISGKKTFEVRKNDRAYQKGDVLRLREWHPEHTSTVRVCDLCGYYGQAFGHWNEASPALERVVSFVYSGDPRFGGIEPGYVVLGLS